MTYATPAGGLPPQTQLTTDRAHFTDWYAVIPKGTMTDIVTSNLPHWVGARAWVLARPMTGFSETFAQLIVELSPNGHSNTPEPIDGAQAVLFVTSGVLTLTCDGDHSLTAGGYAYIPPHTDWSVKNDTDAPVTFHWIRKKYVAVDGIDAPDLIISHDDDVAPVSMPDTDGRWATTRFVDHDDMRHDMHVNIVTFEAGGVIPFAETHVMEHGLFILEGKAVYLLNKTWVEVEAGDFLWLRAFCPQACYAGGPGKFRYLLYKDVNRHAELSL
jgi:(S)-ureidoglycine aminohydrolase